MTKWIVVQEGGSSVEIYVTGWETEEEAINFREECEQAAYRTSEPIKIPDEVFASQALFDLLDAVANGCINVEYPSA